MHVLSNSETAPCLHRQDAHLPCGWKAKLSCHGECLEQPDVVGRWSGDPWHRGIAKFVDRSQRGGTCHYCIHDDEAVHIHDMIQQLKAGFRSTDNIQIRQSKSPELCCNLAAQCIIAQQLVPETKKPNAAFVRSTLRLFQQRVQCVTHGVLFRQDRVAACPESARGDPRLGRATAYCPGESASRTHGMGHRRETPFPRG